MKGIIGIIGEHKPKALEQMSRCLSHRGNVILKTGDAFGIGQLSTGLEVAPFHQEGITVISDARIDNQPEILVKIEESGSPTMSVNELIFRAYLKLQLEFVELLVGDYSIIIVDEIRQKVFLIRDHLGVRPLYYCFKQGFHFAFASEPKALLSLDFVSSVLNSEKLRTYLQWPTDLRPYQKTTFFQDIFSVIPATILEVDMDLCKTKETFYWKINLERFCHLTTESLIIQEYQKSFERAVRRRLQTTTGVQVSGGLDSSSVFKVAEKFLNKEQLYSAHFYPGTPETDERVFAKEIIRDTQKNHLQIERNSDSQANIKKLHACIDWPDVSTVPTATKIIPELTYFKDNKVTVVLTGHEGDTVVDTGVSHLLNLVINLNLKALEEAIGKGGATSKAKKVYLIKKVLQDKYAMGGVVQALKFLATLITHGGISLIDFAGLTVSFSRYLLKKSIDKITKKRTNSSDRPQYTPDTLTGATGEHFRRISSAGIIDINETLNLTGAAFGIEYAHPFLDKDFIELSLFVPEQMRIGPGGLTRYHFRQAMTGILPEKVRLRQSKVHFNTPIWLIMIDITNAYLQIHPLDPATKEKLVKIKTGLQNMDPEHLAFKKTKQFQRLLFLELWKKRLS